MDYDFQQPWHCMTIDLQDELLLACCGTQEEWLKVKDKCPPRIAGYIGVMIAAPHLPREKSLSADERVLRQQEILSRLSTRPLFRQRLERAVRRSHGEQMDGEEPDILPKPSKIEQLEEHKPLAIDETPSSAISERLLKAIPKEYKYAHMDYLSTRSTAYFFSFLIGVPVLPFAIFVAAVEEFSFRVDLITPVMLIIMPLVGLSYVITNAIAAKIRLQFIKDILEQEGYMIVMKTGEYDRNTGRPDIKILEGPPGRLSDFRYFDANRINALKSGKLSGKEISSVPYLVVPVGRINKYYVYLFS